jgi:hypothetical protein
MATLSGHDYTGEYFAKMNVPESTWCLCLTSDGAPVLHTHLHTFRECRRFSAHHHILEEAIPDLHDPEWTTNRLGEPKALDHPVHRKIRCLYQTRHPISPKPHSSSGAAKKASVTGFHTSCIPPSSIPSRNIHPNIHLCFSCLLSLSTIFSFFF